MLSKIWTCSLALLLCTSFLLVGCGGQDGDSRLDAAGSTNSDSLLDLTNSISDDSKLDDLNNVDTTSALEFLNSVDTTSRLDQFNGAPSGSATSSRGSSSSPSGGIEPDLEFLDCSNLDPNKVYFLGDMIGGKALMELEGDKRFCVGFPGSPPGGIIAGSGEVIYSYGPSNASTATIYKMTPDEIVKHTLNNTLWVYPDDSKANDSALSEAPTPVNEMAMRGGSGDEIYTTVSSRDIYLNGSLYYHYEPSSMKLLGVMPDGSLLITNYIGLLLIDTGFNVIPLTSPNDTSTDFYGTSRLFIDPVTGNQSVWVISRAGGGYLNSIDSRWSIDLVTQTVTNDGTLVPEPEHISIAGDKAVRIDGSGNVIQVVLNRLDQSNMYYMVLKRPLESSGNPSVILHSESDFIPLDDETLNWGFQPVPFIHVEFGGRFVTGP